MIVKYTSPLPDLVLYTGEDRGEIRQCLYDEIAAPSGFLKHLGLHPLQLVRGERKFEAGL